jgi:hypothetical protein
MRDGSTFEVDASYIEVANDPTCSTFLLLGPVPGYPMAILAAVPVEAAKSVVPAPMVARSLRR